MRVRQILHKQQDSRAKTLHRTKKGDACRELSMVKSQLRSVLFTPGERTPRVATLLGENGALNPLNPQPNPEPVGHTMVIHDFDGGRIACSPITDVLELRHPLLGFKV